jgi:hypothetical protein
MDLSYQRFRRMLSARNFFLAVPKILDFYYYFKSARASSIRSLWIDLSIVEDGGGKYKNSSFRRIRRLGGIFSIQVQTLHEFGHQRYSEIASNISYTINQV